ncbi:MAG TPA: 30S ribosomal protein S8e [Candidatus Nanoarchaeia archaeon]|nr:30S ribosomal protein S8e [Candidatus Nanoarchaeia archaeon]
MARTSSRSKRKVSGGLYKRLRKKRLTDLARNPALTKIASTRKSNLRTQGGHNKIITLSTNEANIYDPKTKKFKKATIKMVVENKANKDFVRMNILTKGAIIETDLGKARIINRPGQEPQINAILV